MQEDFEESADSFEDSEGSNKAFETNNDIKNVEYYVNKNDAESFDGFSDCKEQNEDEEIYIDEKFDFSDCLSETVISYEEKDREREYSFSDCEIKDWKTEIDFSDTYNSKERREKTDEYKYVPISDGVWKGKKGDSEWIPDDDKIPQKSNPREKNWATIKEEFEIEGIRYNDGEPDFSELSKGEVKISNFTTNRDVNFEQADIEEARIRRCTPEEIKAWRQENKYTWHEHKDCQTMSLVPSIVHNNVSHSGGISVEKKKMNLWEDLNG